MIAHPNHTDQTIITFWADTLINKTITDPLKKRQFTDFFTILVQNEKNIPDILRESDIRFSRYDNVKYGSTENVLEEATILENTDL